jgi:hypothetical protein
MRSNSGVSFFMSGHPAGIRNGAMLASNFAGASVFMNS